MKCLNFINQIQLICSRKIWKTYRVWAFASPNAISARNARNYILYKNHESPSLTTENFKIFRTQTRYENFRIEAKLNENFRSPGSHLVSFVSLFYSFAENAYLSPSVCLSVCPSFRLSSFLSSSIPLLSLSPSLSPFFAVCFSYISFRDYLFKKKLFDCNFLFYRKNKYQN